MKRGLRDRPGTIIIFNFIASNKPYGKAPNDFDFYVQRSSHLELLFPDQFLDDMEH